MKRICYEMKILGPPPHGSTTAAHLCSGSVPCIRAHSDSQALNTASCRHAHHHNAPCLYVHRHSQFSTQPPLLHSRALKKDKTIYRSFSKSKKRRRQDSLHDYSWIELTSTNERVATPQTFIPITIFMTS